MMLTGELTLAGVEAAVGSAAGHRSWWARVIAEVEVTEGRPSGPRIDEVGIHGLHLMEDGRTTRGDRDGEANWTGDRAHPG